MFPANPHQKRLVKHVKDENGQFIGTVIARRNRLGDILFGWSKVNTEAGDTFDRHTGLIKALRRSNKGRLREIWPTIPEPLQQAMVDMKVDATRYFKDCWV